MAGPESGVGLCVVSVAKSLSELRQETAVNLALLNKGLGWTSEVGSVQAYWGIDSLGWVCGREGDMKAQRDDCSSQVSNPNASGQIFAEGILRLVMNGISVSYHCWKSDESVSDRSAEKASPLLPTQQDIQSPMYTGHLLCLKSQLSGTTRVVFLKHSLKTWLQIWSPSSLAILAFTHIAYFSTLVLLLM